MGLKSCKKGTVVFIIIGLLSVMLFFAFAVSKRMSGQTYLLTVADTTQVARYFLESYCNDVLRQLRKVINDPRSDAFKVIRETTGEGTINSSFFKPSSLLEEMEDNWKVRSEPPKITIIGGEELLYPKCLIAPKHERQGTIKITCSITLMKRRYSLEMSFPYKTVMVLTPLLREFLLFCDQISAEQTAPAGEGDKINILYTEKSDVLSPKTHPNHPGAGMPIVLAKNSLTNPYANGSVFLGRDDRKIYLNLGGESKNRLDYSMVAATTSGIDSGVMCDLWQVEARFFSDDPTQLRFDERGECFVDENGNPVALRGIKLSTQIEDLDAYLYLLGFSSEISEDGKGHFANTDRKLDHFLAAGQADPLYKDYYQNNRKYLSYASSLKLLGCNEEVIPGQPGLNPDYNKVPRFIYGKVYSRFILLSFFKPPSGSGAVQEIPYNTDPGARLEAFNKFDGSTVEFKPKGPYQKYMSRIVQDMSTNRMLLDPNATPKLDNCLEAKDFVGRDGLKFNSGGRFDAFAPEWVVNIKSSAVRDFNEAFKRSIYSRISKFFRSQAEFESYAIKKSGENVTELRLDGVLYVDGDVEIPPIILSSTKVGGGILVAKGKITLNEITRGVNVEKPADVQAFTKNFKQDNFLTFVSLKPTYGGDSICFHLKGNNFLGVQLVALSPETVQLPTLIDFSPKDPDKSIFIFGGLALSSPGLKDTVKKLFQPMVLTYVPCMSDPKPAVKASILAEVKGYEFYTD